MEEKKSWELKPGDPIYVDGMTIRSQGQGAFDAHRCWTIKYKGSWVDCPKCGHAWVNEVIHVDVDDLVEKK